MIIIKGNNHEIYCNSHNSNNRESTDREATTETDKSAKKMNVHLFTTPPPSPYSLLFSPHASTHHLIISLYFRNLQQVIGITS